MSINNEKSTHIRFNWKYIRFTDFIICIYIYIDNACAGVSCANGGSCRLDPDDGSALCCCATGFTGANCTVSGNTFYIKSFTTMNKKIFMERNLIKIGVCLIISVCLRLFVHRLITTMSLIFENCLIILQNHYIAQFLIIS